MPPPSLSKFWFCSAGQGELGWLVRWGWECWPQGRVGLTCPPVGSRTVSLLELKLWQSGYSFLPLAICCCLSQCHNLVFQNICFLLDSVGEGEGGMFQENSIETCILSRVKQITSPVWMHETSAQTWCTGKTQRDRVEGGGRGTGKGNTCKSMADSF